MSIDKMIAFASRSMFQQAAESVTYTAFQGDPITLDAIVFRHGVHPISESPKQIAFGFEVWIKNDAITHVTEKRDTISLATTANESAIPRVVTKVIDSEGGVWKLQVN